MIWAVSRVSPVKSVGALRFGSSGRVRNAMKVFKKAESMRQMQNIEARIAHTQHVEEQRAAKLERSSEKAKAHHELLEKHKAKKEERIASVGALPKDEEAKKDRDQRKSQRTARRATARAIIREANVKLAALRAVPRTESL